MSATSTTYLPLHNTARAGEYDTGPTNAGNSFNLIVWFSFPGARSLANRRTLVTLIVGVLVGFSIAAISLRVNRDSLGGFEYFVDGPSPDHHHEGLGHGHNGQDLKYAEGPEEEGGQHDVHDQAHASENATVANKLYDEVRVLCWIMTNPSNHKKKARHVKRTWGKRCNILLFMSSAEGA